MRIPTKFLLSLKKAILKASHVDKYLEAVGIALMSKNIL